MVRLATLVLLVALPLPAQATHLVGPGGHPQIAGAISVASPGDIILVQPGAYIGFNASKGLTIRALVPGTVNVTAALFVLVEPPSGQIVNVVGLNLPAVLVRGDATFERCTIANASMVLLVSQCTLRLVDCTLRSLPVQPFPLTPGPAIEAHQALVSAVRTRFEGGPAGSPTAAASPAIELFDSTFHGSELQVLGGTGGLAAPALRGYGSSRAWISDSMLVADPTQCPFVGANGRLDRCAVSPSCSGTPTGLLLGIDSPSPLAAGSWFHLAFRTQPQDLVAVWANSAMAGVLIPELEQPLWLGATGAHHVSMLQADSSGVVVGAWLIPANPAIVDRAMYFQGFSFAQWPLLTSPVAGGVIR
jgi:hypothetical protein